MSIFVFISQVTLVNTTVAQSANVPAESLYQYSEALRKKDFARATQYALDFAGFFQQKGDVDKADNYIIEALTHAKKSKDQQTLYNAYSRYASFLYDQKKYTKAAEAFVTGLTSSTQLKDRELIKESLLNISLSYDKAGKYKKAIEFADEALLLSIKDKDIRLQEKCYLLLSDLYLNTGNTKRSEEYKAHYEVLVKAQHHEEKSKQEVTLLLKQIEKAGQEKTQTQRKLSEQTNKLNLTNDSLRMIEGSLLATNDSLRVLEEISRNRQLEIDLLQKDKELANARINEQKAQLETEAVFRNFIIVGSLLSVALIIVLIISYRKKVQAKEKIEQQNKNIRSSINYAKRIQEAMLPKIDHYKSLQENSFILFKPRDTVSGDFYWFSTLESNNNDFAFAAVDCTGHGVPGAFMSMIGINSLNALIGRGVNETHHLLNALDKEIRSALKQEVSGNNDGMDVALCIYRKEKQILEFSGAKNPLIYIQNQELFQIKGDVHSIGGSKKKEIAFKKHEIAIDKPTHLYLFSDGFKDQFGGRDNTKFMSKRLNQLLLDIHQLPLQEQMTRLNSTVEEWKGRLDQTDDILVIGLKLNPN